MTTTLPPRIATLVLVDSAGRLLGALPPLQAETPWSCRRPPPATA
jgi:hypothetical protein